MTNAIDQFLNNWRVDAMAWYVKQFIQFRKLFMVKKVLMDEYGYHTTRPSQVIAEDYQEAHDNLRKFLRGHPDNVAGVLQMMFYHDNQNDINPSKKSAYDFISDILTKEMERKKKHLIAKIEKKAGKIISAKGLSLGVDANLNGLVIGDLAAVNVRTIYAGGYNIQCLHYRVLIKTFK